MGQGAGHRAGGGQRAAGRRAAHRRHKQFGDEGSRWYREESRGGTPDNEYSSTYCSVASVIRQVYY